MTGPDPAVPAAAFADETPTDDVPESGAPSDGDASHGHPDHPNPVRRMTPQQLSPGIYVQPGEVGYVVQGQIMPDGQAFVVIRFEHAAGSTVLPLPVEFAAGLGQALLDESDRIAVTQGIVVPSPSRLIVPR